MIEFPATAFMLLPLGVLAAGLAVAGVTVAFVKRDRQRSRARANVQLAKAPAPDAAWVAAAIAASRTGVPVVVEKGTDWPGLAEAIAHQPPRNFHKFLKDAIALHKKLAKDPDARPYAELQVHAHYSVEPEENWRPRQAPRQVVVDEKLPSAILQP